MIFFFVFCSIYTTFLLLRSRKLLGLGKKRENLFVLLSTFRNFAIRNHRNDEYEAQNLCRTAVDGGSGGGRQGNERPVGKQHQGLRAHDAERRVELHCGRAGGGLLRLPHESHAVGIFPQCQAPAAGGSRGVRLRQVADDAYSFRLEHAGRAAVFLRGYRVV